MARTSRSTQQDPFDRLKEKGLFVPLFTAVIALFIGALIGMMIGGKSEAVAAPAKTVTVQTSTTPAPTETVTMSAVPQECLDALDTADRGFTLASDMSGEFKDAIDGITTNDIDAVQDASKNIRSINTSLSNLSPQYNANKQACRELALR